MKVILLHLDLGIGGAEKLVVNTGVAMLELGHDIEIYTSHHDPNHCFQETKLDGKLYKCIKVYGDWLPRNIWGKATAFCGILRMIYLSLIVVTKEWWNILFQRQNRCNLIFLDGISAPIPLLLLTLSPIIFYCHFPDKYLCVERNSSYKKFYRRFIDWIEEITTGCASIILVNSLFTRSKFKEAFEVLGKSCVPSVLYPTIDESNDEAGVNRQYIAYGDKYDHIFVSLNRYERKKNIELALESMKYVTSNLVTRSKILLVIAGGYDVRVTENVEYLKELCKKAESLGLTYVNSGLGSMRTELVPNCDVIFRCSISNQERQALLTYSTALIYTPSNEHFGIVPLEAMYCKTPVVAVNNGGPLETIIDNQTGFLCESNANDFGNALKKFVDNAGMSENFGINGKKHVEGKFTNTMMKNDLKHYLDLGSKGGSKNDRARVMLYACSFYFVSVGSICCYLYILFTLL